MNQPKTVRKILLILADSITGDIVLNNKLFNKQVGGWSVDAALFAKELT